MDIGMSCISCVKTALRRQCYKKREKGADLADCTVFWFMGRAEAPGGGFIWLS